jgi:D-alanine--poly(phosphoribitol) ligase subunit 1
MTPGLDAVALLLARAAATPVAPAVVSATERVNFAEFACRVRRFAAGFARLPDPLVLIALPAGADAYAAMFAAGLCGGTYTPVNVAAPVEKLRHIARLLRPSIIFGDNEGISALAEAAPGAVPLRPADMPEDAIFAGDGRRHAHAYVIFTSGSTGLPKGVVIPRRALDHYVGWITGARLIRPGDRVAQFAQIGFDLSIFEIYGALCCGAALFPVQGQGDRLWPARMIRREGITVWTSVPSVVSLMMRAGDVTAANLGSVRLFNFCGEPLLREHLTALFAACPGTQVQNTYGPTEATVSMTALRLTAHDYAASCGLSVALGAPIPGMGLHLLGGRHAGEGEIVITGPQLASGYWQDPERTARVFKDITIGGRRMRGYFTGDWAERRGSHVFFRERLDFQVKVRGVRIELDEVAAAIRECGWPVVCVCRHGNGLAAVVERRQGLDLDPLLLSRRLALRLEPEAIPATIRVIDHMPRTDNGKIDRQAAASWLDAAPVP